MTIAATRYCAGCRCDIGPRPSCSVTINGWRYEVCGYGCAERLIQQVSASSTSTPAATVDTLTGPDVFTVWTGSGRT